MALGYEGWMKIGDAYALGTGGGIPESETKLESSSGYGGQIKAPIGEIGIGSPRIYDWQKWDGSVDFEANDGVLGVILGAALDRQNSVSIFVKTRQGNIQQGSVFWNSISLQASQGSLVTGSLDFTGLGREYAYGLWEQTSNGEGVCQLIGDPIPYWNTSVSGGTFLSWNIDFSQDVVRFFTCENNIVPVEPKFLAVGPMSIVFSGISIENVSSSSLTIGVGSRTLSFGKVEMQNHQDTLVDPNAPVVISIEAHPYEIVSLG